MATTTNTPGQNQKNVSGSERQSAGSYRPQKLDEALRTLDEAIATQGADLKQILTSDYQHLKSALNDMAPKVGEAFRKAGGGTMDYMKEVSDVGMRRSREMASSLDESVRRNPWAVIGGVALGSVVVGYLLGRGSAPSYETERYRSIDVH